MSIALEGDGAIVGNLAQIGRCRVPLASSRGFRCFPWTLPQFPRRAHAEPRRDIHAWEKVARTRPRDRFFPRLRASACQLPPATLRSMVAAPARSGNGSECRIGIPIGLCYFCDDALDNRRLRFASSSSNRLISRASEFLLSSSQYQTFSAYRTIAQTTKPVDQAIIARVDSA